MVAVNKIINMHLTKLIKLFVNNFLVNVCPSLCIFAAINAGIFRINIARQSILATGTDGAVLNGCYTCAGNPDILLRRGG